MVRLAILDFGFFFFPCSNLIIFIKKFPKIAIIFYFIKIGKREREEGKKKKNLNHYTTFGCCIGGWNLGCGEVLFFSLFVPFIIVVVGFLNDFFVGWMWRILCFFLGMIFPSFILLLLLLLWFLDDF
jgi:hypothetical protein